LQAAVGLDRNRAQGVFGIGEKEAVQAGARSVVNSGDEREGEHDLGDGDEDAAVAMVGSVTRPHLDIEQVLLAALARSREAAVGDARLVAVWFASHFFGGRAASESSMMRAQSWG
jgi:hypothetical protein